VWHLELSLALATTWLQTRTRSLFTWLLITTVLISTRTLTCYLFPVPVVEDLVFWQVCSERARRNHPLEPFTNIKNLYKSQLSETLVLFPAKL
jgi:hypothetical protein